MASDPQDAQDAQSNTNEQQETPTALPKIEKLEQDVTIIKDSRLIEKDAKTVEETKQTIKQDINITETKIVTSRDAQVIEKDIKTVESKKIVQTAEKDVKPYEEFLLKFNNDWSMNLAGAVAYHLLTAIFPIAIAIISILGGINAGVQQLLIGQIKTILPAPLSSSDVIATILHKLPHGSGILWIIAILIAIFTGSRLFVLIDGCFNIIYQVHSRKPLRQNMMAIGMLLLFILLTPIMVFASSAPALVLSILGDTAIGKLPQEIIFSVLGILGSLVASIVLFAAIYVIVPNQHISIRNSWRGTLVAALALQLFLILFPFYAAHFLNGYVGQVGFAIILLAFFYFFAVILLLGAEVNAFYAEGVRSIPLATLIHSYVDANKKSR